MGRRIFLTCLMQTTNELTNLSAALTFCMRNTVADHTFNILVSFYVFAQIVGWDWFKFSFTLAMGWVGRSSKAGHSVLLSVYPLLVNLKLKPKNKEIIVYEVTSNQIPIAILFLFYAMPILLRFQFPPVLSSRKYFKKVLHLH